MEDGSDGRMMEMTVKIVASYVANNTLESAALPDLIRSVHSAISTLSGEAPAPEKTPDPAVAISKSVTPEYIICLEDGRKLKMLKRYLRTRYDMSPEDYRAKWNLPADYPMVAPNYARLRSRHAKQIGLGKKK
ncbi:MucR family transcriptional regulator [Hyphomonas sp.]|uniref:MucR family transcriptional regulator n=1 Tax=Hyphomonas sp. TaxID=87 RepID=UPI00391ADBD1